jgi:hypothetical protein
MNQDVTSFVAHLNTKAPNSNNISFFHLAIFAPFVSQEAMSLNGHHADKVSVICPLRGCWSSSSEVQAWQA